LFQNRKQAILRRSAEREAKLEQIRSSSRKSTGALYAFGSRASLPRMSDLDSPVGPMRAASNAHLPGTHPEALKSGMNAPPNRAVSACNLASPHANNNSKHGMMHASHIAFLLCFLCLDSDIFVHFGFVYI